MEKLTGHGRPYPRLEGEVGQHYEDLDTGDIYECRISSQYSPTHGWPVGGYVWERRAKGEDVRELYGSGGSGGSGGSLSIVFCANSNHSVFSYMETIYAPDGLYELIQEMLTSYHILDINIYSYSVEDNGIHVDKYAFDYMDIKDDRDYILINCGSYVAYVYPDGTVRCEYYD